VAIWSTIEVGLGIIAGSMATFRPLLRIILGKAKFSTSYNLNGTSSGGTLPASGPPVHSGSQKDLIRDTWSPMTIDDTGSPSSHEGNHQKQPTPSNVK